MKKSLKVIATATLAFSMFASVAMAAETTATPTATEAATTVKTSKDFKDLAGLDAGLLAKIDAMLAKKYFEGTADDSFGIKENMTRAQFAKVLALVAGVPVDATVKTSSFADVKADDSANGWAIPYIEAAKKAGLIDGKSDTSFDPSANVTLGEFATALLKGLGVKPDTTGTPWYADAIKQAVAQKLLSEGTDGSKFATRADLVVGAHTADAAIANVGKVSVTEAKATGVQQVTVNFSKAVDDTKAKIALTKGTVAVATTAKFADDKKSVVLTLTSVKVTEGSYTATLSGLDAAAVEKTTATFTAENEKVAKLSFVNASDKIPQVADLILSIKAENQYGENATLNGSNYSVFPTSTGTLTRNADTGYLDLKVNTSNKTTYPTEIGVLPVTVSLNQSAVSVSKTFKIGTEQLVSKVELKDAAYANGKTALSSEGDQATFDITRYDQYGFKMVAPASTTITPVITPTDMNVLEKTVADNKVVVKVAAGKKVDKTADYTVTYYDGGASATSKVSLKAASVPTKLEFGTFTGTIAEGDTAAKYIPIVAYDAEGKQLSAQDIVDNAASISFTVSGATVPADSDVVNGIVKYGENKGKLKITTVSAKERGVVYLYMSIYNANIQTQAQLPLTVVATRTPESVILSGTTEPAKKALATATTTYKVLVKDQYGETLANVPAGYAVTANVEGTTSVATIANGTVAQTLVAGDNTIAADLSNSLNDKEIKFTANTAGTAGKTTLKFTITKGTGSSAVEISSPFKRTVEVIENKDLTYSANTLSDLFAIQTNDKSKATGSIFVDGGQSKFAKGVAVTVKDKAGDTVAVPDALKAVKTAFVVDSNIATVTPAGKVLGQRVGTTTVTAVVYKANGETQDFTYTVNVKADAPVVATLTADANKTFSIATDEAKDIEQVINAKVVDNYGAEYKYVVNTAPTANVNYIKDYNDFFGVQYIVSNVQGGGTVQVVNGKIDVTGTVNEFIVKAVSSNGKTTTTLVTVTP